MLPGTTLKTLRAQFLVECLNLPGASGVDDARWEHFQIEHLNDDSLFRIENKSRQVAWSFTSACEAIAEAMLEERGSIFVSINLEEAKEKIRYARSIYENLQGVSLPKIKTDNQLEIEFDNGARLISLPSKPPRGKPRMNVYGDEFAHVMRDRQIYTAMLPVISKGGRVRLGSSPLGASGMFWEIYTEAMKEFPGYTRKRTPWWEVQYFSLNVVEARKLAPQMESFERVEMFGNDRIKAIFANMLLEDFQQEYEAEFVDETTAWISWDEIKANQSDSLDCMMAVMRGSDISKIFAAIEAVARLIEAGKVEKVLAAGMDVGRTRNTSEIFLLGMSTTSTYPLRLALTMDNVEFDDQLEVIVKVMKELPVVKMLIDQNGIGRNLAEKASKTFPSKVEGVDFTNETKKLWATDAKMLIQQHKTPLPIDRDIAYQIHSIKRKISAAKNLIFDTDRNEKHHADKFWAWALALNAATSKRKVVKAGPVSLEKQSTWRSTL